MIGVNVLKRLGKIMKDFAYGMTAYPMVKTFEKLFDSTLDLMMFCVMADMFGYPLTNYYKLRLLPYWLPKIDRWRKDLLREIDITERIGE